MTYVLAISGEADNLPRETPGRLLQGMDLVEAQWGPPKAVVTGCADGIDTDAFLFSAVRWPGILVYATVPAAPHNTELVKFIRTEFPSRIRQCRPASTAARAYMLRNDETARIGDKLVAWPFSAQEVQRSGTWATIRRFQKRQKPVIIVPLKEDN